MSEILLPYDRGESVRGDAGEEKARGWTSP